MCWEAKEQYDTIYAFSTHSGDIIAEGHSGKCRRLVGKDVEVHGEEEERAVTRLSGLLGFGE